MYNDVIKLRKAHKSVVGGFMKKGRLTMDIINNDYNLINISIGYRLYQHNCDKDNIICLRIVDNIYCYTNDSLFCTICNKVKYEWYKLSE